MKNSPPGPTTTGTELLIKVCCKSGRMSTRENEKSLKVPSLVPVLDVSFLSRYFVLMMKERGVRSVE
jgi:hypothetical protein